MPKTVNKKKTARPAKRKGPVRTSTAIGVRQSKIHGKGVFARRAIRKGARLAEYWGPVITWEEAERRYPVDPVPYHTFLFEIGDGSTCIDGQKTRSVAKWINHACRPNCEAVEDDDERVFIEARRAIEPGEELTYDYNLTYEGRISLQEAQRQFPCWCGAKSCRGTMLGKKFGRKKSAKKKTATGKPAGGK